MKRKILKKAIASIVSAVTLVSGGSINVYSPVVNADGSENYLEALALSMYFFDANQCGAEVDDNPLTWRGNCHTYDGNASLSIAEGLDSSALPAIKAANGGKDTVDVSGGYHDAGDHIKFNLTMGFAASSLAMSWYLNPGIYYKAGCEGHMCEILRKTSDYFMKTTFLNDDGSVAAICHVVADGGVDHSIWTAPEEQTYERKTYWLCSGNNNSAVCGEMAAALAGTAYIWQYTDAEYAAECLKYAKAIYDFGMKNKGNECGGLGNFYSTDSMCEDELALAQAWLYLNGKESLPDWKPEKGCYNGKLYDCYLHSWDKVWSGYSAMMYKITGDKIFYDEMVYELNNGGGLTEGKYNADGWGASRYNCARQLMALGAADGDGSSQYAKGAKYQMDYILGNNQLGYSFLMGYGSKWPTHIHHRAANPGGEGVTSAANPDSKYVLYGALIGGPDSGGNYQDHADQYQFTEPALDYNGCFALACAGLANLYGGDESAINGLTAKASEINESYKFPEMVQPPEHVEPTTEPVTEPTEETTETSEETTEPTVETTEPVEETTKPTEMTESTEQTEPTYEPPVTADRPSEPTDRPTDTEHSGYDVDSNGTVDTSDIVMLAKYLVGDYDTGYTMSVNGEDYPYIEFGKSDENKRIPFDNFTPDVNGDGDVNVFDYIALRRALLNGVEG